MRPTTLFLIFMIGALGFLFFIGKQMGVKPPKLPELSLPKAVTSLTQERDQDSKANGGIYKWRDESGAWHYGDQPPEGVHAQTVDVDPNRNVLASPKQAPSSAEAENIPGVGNMPGIAGPVSEAKKLLEMDPMARQSPGKDP